MSKGKPRGTYCPRVAITAGDINGIGPEVVLKCLSDRRMFKFFTPVVIGSVVALEEHARILGLSDINLVTIASVDEISRDADRAIHVLDPVPDQKPPVRLGKITEASGRISMACVGMATDLCIEGTVDAMVTAPISKEAIARAGFRVPGHTEYIAARTNCSTFTMMMVADDLRVGLVTAHIPLADVPAAITVDAIKHKLRIIGASLTTDFGVSRPRIAVLGLNPHAGDGGVIGTEETSTIMTAIEASRGNGQLVYGPFPADGFFASRKYCAYDAVLAMYHDQGLTPFKVLSFNSGINFTAGLPIVRTSPDHGTAYDIAGRNEASAESMRNAIYAAIDIARRRLPGAAKPQAA